MPTQALDKRPVSVLLVEDNEDDAALLERYLRKTGFQPSVTRVEDATAFQAALQAEPAPSVVLADYNLPNFSGPEALRLLRSTSLDIPFIMMSGAMSEETAVESMRAGAQDFVIKQNIARLAPALERELREAETRRSRRAVEAALRASEARFHRLIEAMPIGLILAEISGTIAFVNAATAKLLGYAEAELLQGDLNLQHFGLHAPLSEQVSESRQVSVTRKDGTVLDLLVATAFLNPEAASDERRIAVFLVDRTKQKQSEDVLRRTEKLAVAGRLAASVAHEINNPLAAITNCLFLVQQTELTEDGRSFLETAQKELDRVAQITVQTLRFHRQSSRPVLTDVCELCETVLALFDPRLRRQEITVHRDYAKVQPLLAFEGELRQVIVNLLGNAIDASGTGGDIIVRTRQVRMPHLQREGIVLVVADRGTGIGPEAMSHLFEPFFSTKGITGTGLGLWVSKEIVERHSGSIRVHSRPRGDQVPGGTAFRVFLPLGGSPTAASRSDRIDPL